MKVSCNTATVLSDAAAGGLQALCCPGRSGGCRVKVQLQASHSAA